VCVFHSQCITYTVRLNSQVALKPWAHSQIPPPATPRNPLLHRHVFPRVARKTVCRFRPLPPRIFNQPTITTRSPDAGRSPWCGSGVGRDRQDLTGQIRRWNELWSKGQQTNIVVPRRKLRAGGTCQRLCNGPEQGVRALKSSQAVVPANNAPLQNTSLS